MEFHSLHNRLEFFDYRDEGVARWRSIHITDGDHPYMKNWWVPGLQIGYEHTFCSSDCRLRVQATGEGMKIAPSFQDGLACRYILMQF